MLVVKARAQLGDFTLDIAFEGPSDGVTILFGPSGAGKSATLAVVAGLLRASDARVAIGDRVLTDTASRHFIPPERRRIGMVHQQARLFPHMPVRHNLLYGWRRAKTPRRIGMNDVVAVLAIGHLLDRRVANLSGGERQRVALGRALLSQPDLLLLDEPVSALDAARRAEVLDYIMRLRTAFGLPMLYVTHDAQEARAIGDRLVRIEHGKVVAQGTPADLLPTRGLTGLVTGHDVGGTLVRIQGNTARLPRIDAAIGSIVTFSW